MRQVLSEHGRLRRIVAGIPGYLLPVLGVVIFFAAPHLTSWAYSLVGGAMVLEGLNLMLQGLLTQEYRQRHTKLLACAVAVTVIGVLLLLKQGQSIVVLGTLWGVVSMLQAVELMNEFFFRLASGGRWFWTLAEAAVELVLAIILLWDPHGAFASHVRILGIQVFLSAFLPKEHNSKA